MNEMIESLLTAYEEHDADTYADIWNRVRQSRDDRQQAGAALLLILSNGDAHRAEMAINTLSFTGLVREDEVYEQLIRTAEDLLTPQFLSDVAAIESRRIKGDKRRLSPEARLLRSILRALATRRSHRATTLVERITVQFSGTPLAAKIVKWKNPSDDQDAGDAGVNAGDAGVSPNF
jgi:hypothetical protein